MKRKKRLTRDKAIFNHFFPAYVAGTLLVLGLFILMDGVLELMTGSIPMGLLFAGISAVLFMGSRVYFKVGIDDANKMGLLNIIHRKYIEKAEQEFKEVK